MLQTNTQSDPIVEILRLAYRRGLALRQVQEEKNNAINPQPLQSDVMEAGQELPRQIKEVPPRLPAAQTIATEKFPSQ